MQTLATRRPIPDLKQIVAEASRSLATLDAERLEELADACAALRRDVILADAVERIEIAEQARQAAQDMAVFARVLEATRNNLAVLERLRELRFGVSGYGSGPILLEAEPSEEAAHGID